MAKDFIIAHVSRYDIIAGDKFDSMPKFKEYCEQNRALFKDLDLVDRMKEMLGRSGLTKQLHFFNEFIRSQPVPSSAPKL